ncbi:MAG: hypothetical protein RJA90_1858, partial [Bacteroidota bacterium]
MQNYLQQVQKNLGYRATWEPHRPMKVGTYGKIHQGIFSAYGHIDDLNIVYSVDKLKTSNQLTYKSEEKGSYTLKAKGEINPLFQKISTDEAGLLIIFKKDNSIVFKIQDITYFTLQNKAEIAEKLHNLSLVNKWDASYLMITETLQSEKTSILLSKKKNSEVEIKYENGGNTGLVDIDFFGEIIRSKGMSLQFTTSSDSTPLFKLSRLKEAVLVPEKNRQVLEKPIPGLIEVD